MNAIAEFFIVFKEYFIEVLPFLMIGFLLIGLIMSLFRRNWWKDISVEKG